MSSRQSLYHAYCLLSSAKEVIKGSASIGCGSLTSWVESSTLTRPISSKFQWFYDPEWEKARALSESVRSHPKPKGKSSKKGGVRHYSTHAFANANRQMYSSSAKKVVNSKAAEKEFLYEWQKAALQSSEIPSSRISRLFHYGSLAAGVGLSAATDGFSQAVRGRSPDLKSLILSDANIDRITQKFSKMRGAALKIGQMMSFQDENVLPKELYIILSRVQNGAHYMPQRQLDRILNKELGLSWRQKFSEFDPIPIAAASIGQVHEAVLPSGQEVVVKIQYPGVKDSIDSDLNNVLMFLTASRLLPKGLFLDKTVANARTELKWECDYKREAAALQKFETLLQGDPVLVTPKVFEQLTTDNIITMTKMQGKEIMKLPEDTSQDTRNFISEAIMLLCLREIAEFKFMQTDPNWANFLYNENNKTLELLDFGASRGFSEEFIRNYRRLLTAGSLRDRAKVAQISEQLGYLTGLESKAMVDAHVDSVLTLSEPFVGPADQIFDFSQQTVTDRIRGNINLMLKERLCPPPEETYSLHRKFSGVFLLCARMRAQIPMSKLFQEHFALYD
ncbi:LAME_0C07514g1_1 [Lachancea meyersii CBS 8951]|uniref:LAME_0C07514g1_1 n=1 Tax=Lachancea meyersii CBS 8951 TaxID=1266667 RepID=A0A1G4J2M1_9SACH|nr:LAME_0C07514g1_1 [Lachancea meyersii CBS 8951]